MSHGHSAKWPRGFDRDWPTSPITSVISTEWRPRPPSVPVRDISLFTSTDKNYGVAQRFSRGLSASAHWLLPRRGVGRGEPGLGGLFCSRAHCVLWNGLLFLRGRRLASPPGSSPWGRGQCPLTPQNAAGTGDRRVGTDCSHPLKDTASVPFEAQVTAPSYRKPSWIPEPGQRISSGLFTHLPCPLLLPNA